MLEDAQAPVLLTQALVAEKSAGIIGVQRVCLDTDWKRLPEKEKKTQSQERGRREYRLCYLYVGIHGQPKA